MSSGSILLRQLQKRQLQQKHNKYKNKNDDNSHPSVSIKEKEVANDNSSTAVPPLDKAEQSQAAASLVFHGDDTNVAASNGTNNAIVTIEVCNGPDCSGLGGGAAFLEIENLISTLDNCRVVVGGCRNVCTMGPNVHIFSSDDIHFSKVDQPLVCRTVVACAVAKTKHPTSLNYDYDTNSSSSSSSSSSVNKLLQLRQDGIRWRKLKEQSMNEKRLKVRERVVVTDSS